MEAVGVVISCVFQISVIGYVLYIFGFVKARKKKKKRNDKNTVNTSNLFRDPKPHREKSSYKRPTYKPTHNNTNSTIKTSDMMADLIKIIPFDKNKVMDKDFEKKLTFDEILKKYQEENNSHVIFINHRNIKGSMGLRFLDTKAKLTLEDATNIMKTLKDLEEEITTLDLIINTTGGSMTAAEIIINAFRNSGCKVRVFIPYYALSAGTLIAITVADEIFLGKNAFVGPIDPQLGWGISAISVVNYSGKLESQKSLSWMGDLIGLARGTATTALERIKNLISNIYETRGIEESVISKTLEELVGKYNHDQPIFYDQIKDIVPMKVIHGLPKEIDELFEYNNGVSFCY